MNASVSHEHMPCLSQTLLNAFLPLHFIVEQPAVSLGGMKGDRHCQTSRLLLCGPVRHENNDGNKPILFISAVSPEIL